MLWVPDMAEVFFAIVMAWTAYDLMKACLEGRSGNLFRPSWIMDPNEAVGGGVGCCVQTEVLSGPAQAYQAFHLSAELEQVLPAPVEVKSGFFIGCPPNVII